MNGAKPNGKPDGGFLNRYGPWALVAGASQGLGAAYAGQIAARGLNVALVARREDALQSLAKHLTGQYGVQVKPICLDLSSQAAAAVLAEQTAGLEIGLLVYNAGYSAVGPFFNTSLEDHLREIDTNCRAPLELAYLFGHRMLARGRGGIILMSSLSSAQGSALIANYAATKAYNMILAEGIWEELRTRGIDVLACAAGAIRTPNYVNSLGDAEKGEAVGTLPPEDVVRETLGALGKQSSIVPGASNRLAAFAMRHLIPRQAAVRLMGSVMRRMYEE